MKRNSTQTTTPFDLALPLPRHPSPHSIGPTLLDMRDASCCCSIAPSVG